MKIAVLKSGAIGDVLMSTPFLRALKKRFPQARIDYHTGKWSAEGLLNNPNLNRIFAYDDSVFHSKSIKGKLTLLKNLRKERYNLLFLLDKHYLMNMLGKATGIKTRIGFNRGREGFPNTKNVKYGPIKHEIDYYLDLAKIVGAKESNKQIDLIVSKKDKEIVNNLTKTLINFIGIVPGGAKNPGGGVVDSRRWPKDKFIQLINRVPNKYTILLLGGKSDSKFNNQILTEITRKKVLNFAGKTNIHQSCELMRRCKCVICSDSGPMHIAAASGTKVISLFGPTNPARKAPLTKGSVALWKDQDIYDKKVEVYGKNPKGKYFLKIEIEDILKCI